MPFNENNEWKPNNPKQIQFLAIPPTVKEAFFGGGAGSGKSELLLMYAIVNGWHSLQGFKQVFMRRTYPEIKREIIPRSATMYRRLGAKYNKSDACWTFPREDQYGSGMEPDGGMIFFGHCENEDDVHNYDGMEINLYTPDELTSFTEYIYTYIGFTRVRTGNPKLPAVIRASGMPGDIGHAFVKKRFIDPAPLGGKIIVGRGGNKRIYIHSTYKDNINGDKNYGQSLEALPSEAERRAKKYGDWSSYEGTVFDEFREKHFPTEPDNALHVVDPFSIPKHWPRIVAIDWGFSAMCSVGWAAISPDRRLYVYRHQSFYREKIEEWTPKVKLFIDRDQPSDIVICHSANQHRGDPHSILEQVTEGLKTPVRLGERDRISGKVLIHEFLRWRQPEITVPTEVAQIDHDLAGWIYRNKGPLEYQNYLRSFQLETNNEVIPKLLFFNQPDVKMVWDALKQCVYVKAQKDGKRKEDVAEFDGDDPYDMLRMLVHSADQFFNAAGAAQEKLDSIDRVMKQYEASGDMTGFYRNMRRVESAESVQPIRRFHKGRRS
jgi:hypothetical protein